jgi:peptide/nickel transport system substrate-binding protein
MLHRIQQLIHDKAMYAPIWELGFIHAQGPRVAESSLGLITGYAFSAPYEDVKLRSK